MPVLCPHLRHQLLVVFGYSVLCYEFVETLLHETNVNINNQDGGCLREIYEKLPFKSCCVAYSCFDFELFRHGLVIYIMDKSIAAVNTAALIAQN